MISEFVLTVKTTDHREQKAPTSCIRMKERSTPSYRSAHMRSQAGPALVLQSKYIKAPSEKLGFAGVIVAGTPVLSIPVQRTRCSREDSVCARTTLTGWHGSSD